MQDQLFKKEFEVLKTAEEIFHNDNYKDNVLLSHYGDLLENYEKLLKFSRKIMKISDIQGMELKTQELEIKNLLNNTNQGFLTFGKDLRVNKEYSLECNNIFKINIRNINILELLSPENREQNEQFAQAFKILFETKDENLKSTTIQILPNMIKVNNYFINIKYQVIDTDEIESGNDKIMLVLTNITEKRKNEDQIMYLSYRDKLTDLYNRAYIENVIPQLKDDLPVSVIMADMNGLKLTNDVFGHEHGDKLLVNLAHVFCKCCRKGDIISRWGGDEFVIILPGTGKNASKKVCDRIKEMCIKVESDPLELSVSLGCATMESPNISMIELISIAENMMYNNKVLESKENRKKMILSMKKILEYKCVDFTGHVERVKSAAMNFAKVLKLEPESLEVKKLSLFIDLHDIGKVAVPQEILDKSSAVSQNEWNIMLSYTEIGFRMAQSIDETFVAQAILTLRERWDGKGYPQGLSGEQIPLISRMVSIIEAFDIMTHDSPYKKAITKEEALKELEKGMGTQFDPHLGNLFLENINKGFSV